VYGRHTEAVAAASRALELTELLGATSDAAWLRAQRGRYRLRAGDLAGARADLTQACAAGEENRTTPVVLTARIGLAVLARRTGEPSDITEVLAELADDTGWMETHLRLLALIEAGRTATRYGDHRAADAHLATALHLAETHPTAALATAEVAEALAELALAEGDPRAAARLLGLATAVRGAPDVGNPDVEDTRAKLGDTPGTEFTMDSEAARKELHARRR
jgi:tetratricopeptide (TPR) repeat protein